MDTSEFLNAKKSFTWKSLIPMDYFMRPPSKAIEEIKNGEIKRQILVICKNMQDVIFILFYFLVIFFSQLIKCIK